MKEINATQCSNSEKGKLPEFRVSRIDFEREILVIRCCSGTNLKSQTLSHSSKAIAITDEIGRTIVLSDRSFSYEFQSCQCAKLKCMFTLITISISKTEIKNPSICISIF